MYRIFDADVALQRSPFFLARGQDHSLAGEEVTAPDKPGRVQADQGVFPGAADWQGGRVRRADGEGIRAKRDKGVGVVGVVRVVVFLAW